MHILLFYVIMSARMTFNDMMITNSVQNQTSKKYRIQYNKSPYNKMEKNDD